MSLFSGSLSQLKLPLKQGDGWYWEGFLTWKEQEDFKNHLWETYDWEQPELTVFGKSHPIPRLAAWIADQEVGYDYAGVKHKLQRWSPVLLSMKKRIEKVTGVTYNSVLLNAYRNGIDKMGWHSDDEKALGPDPLIASLNLGVMRRFDLRNRKDPSDEVKLNLDPGGLLFMGTGIQQNYKHQVPQQKKVEGLRINLTFRNVVELGRY